MLERYFSLTGWRSTCALLFSLLIAGCGNNDSTDNGSGGSGGSTRGQLIQTPPELVGTVTAAQLLATPAARTSCRCCPLADSMVCDVNVHRINYRDGRRQGRGHDRDRRADGADRHRRELQRRATDRALRARHDDRQGFRPHQRQRFRECRGAVPRRILRGAGVHRRRAELRGLRRIDARLSPLSRRGATGERHDRCAEGGTIALPTSSAPTTTDGGSLFVTGYSQGGYVAMATQRAWKPQARRSRLPRHCPDRTHCRRSSTPCSSVA